MQFHRWLVPTRRSRSASHPHLHTVHLSSAVISQNFLSLVIVYKVVSLQGGLTTLRALLFAAIGIPEPNANWGIIGE